MDARTRLALSLVLLRRLPWYPFVPPIVALVLYLYEPSRPAPTGRLPAFDPDSPLLIAPPTAASEPVRWEIVQFAESNAGAIDGKVKRHLH